MGQLRDELLGVPDCWVQRFTWILPSPVEIASCQAASVVSVDDTIRIQHRDDLEDEFVSQLRSSRVAANQEVDDSFHHP